MASQAVGYSKFLKAEVDTLKIELPAEVARAQAEEARLAGLLADVSGALATEKARAEAEEARISAVVADLSGVVASEVARLESEAAAESQARVAAEQAISAVVADLSGHVASEFSAVRAELASAQAAHEAQLSAHRIDVSGGFASLTSQLQAESQARETALDVERARLASLEQWVASNTDEIAVEVDKAINSKVSQQAYDQVVAELQNADSALSQQLASAVSARLSKDEEHSANIERLMRAFEVLLSTYHLEQNGVVITTPRSLDPSA